MDSLYEKSVLRNDQYRVNKKTRSLVLTHLLSQNHDKQSTEKIFITFGGSSSNNYFALEPTARSMSRHVETSHLPSPIILPPCNLKLRDILSRQT